MSLFDRSKKSKKPKTTSPPPPPPRQEAPRRSPASAPPAFQPAGYLAPPPGWTASSPPSAPMPMQQPMRQYPNITVNHNYYLSPPPPQASLRPSKSSGTLAKLNLGSVVDLTHNILPPSLPAKFDDGLSRWQCQGTQLLNQGAALADHISHRFNDIMTLIDGDRYSGHEKELFTYQQPQTHSAQSQASAPPPMDRRLSPKKDKSKSKDNPKGQTTAVAASVISGNSFAKVELYANSRLPLKLPPLKLYISTYPLLTLAATYSERVYDRPTGAERAFHLPADWRSGTKATILKSVPMDSMNTVVFAIRGTATFMDWAVNLNTAPASPSNFLDDPGNFCHAGFLAAARKMVKPVAARLRQLLEEDPSRAGYSLLITGHSAGGAIAALLYSHMLTTAKESESELTVLAGCFRRIHCVTFGAPPVSLLPLETPARRELRKSLFLSFVNEGDPVARADKAYIRSLLDLFATPAPTESSSGADKLKVPSSKSKSSTSLISTKSSKSHKSSSRSRPAGPIWPVPPSTLSNAGRIIVLRSGDAKGPRGKRTVEERLNEGVVAQVVTDEQLRGVIWGDPVAHVMRFYAGRIEILAVGAVTAKGG